MKSILGLVLALMLVGVWSGYAQQSAGQLFQAGLYKEEVEGDLERAIEIYQKIVEEYPANRSVGAKALLHIGLCYEKLGNVEAQQAYARVLQDFGDQTEVVAKARIRLAALGQPPGVVVRPVWAPADDISGMPSPDGRYLSFTHWNSANLAVRDLTTGETRLLTDEGTWMEPDQYAGESVWSPDGQQLAYGWFNKDLYELRLVGLDGSEPRVLYRHEGLKYIRPYAWSRNGQYILAWWRKVPGPGEIGLVSTADGSVRVLKSPTPFSLPMKMSLSPDGRFVVYDGSANKDSNSTQEGIYLLPTDGGREVPLVDHPANDYGPVWTPDGQQMIFFSDRTGTPAAWLLEVVEGKPQGTPRLIQQNMDRMVPMGFTRDGSFYYALKSPHQGGDVYIATRDPATGKILAPPTKVPQSFEGSNTSPDWSPDGQYLAYVSQRGFWSGRVGFCVLVIRDIETGAERELPLTQRFKIRWSPDGRSILALLARSLRLIEAQTGAITLVMRVPSGTSIHEAALSSDGKQVFYLRQLRSRTEYVWSVAVRDIETDEERELLRAPAHAAGRDLPLGGDILGRGLALSPDGQRLALVGDQVLNVMSATGGEKSEVLRLPDSETFPFGVGPVWTPDARHILTGKGKSLYPDDPEASARQLFEVWQIPVGGGEAQKLGLAMKQFHQISVHPDGRRIAFTQPGTGRQFEVWVMENFLSEL